MLDCRAWGGNERFSTNGQDERTLPLQHAASSFFLIPSTYIAVKQTHPLRAGGRDENARSLRVIPSFNRVSSCCPAWPPPLCYSICNIPLLMSWFPNSPPTNTATFARCSSVTDPSPPFFIKKKTQRNPAFLHCMDFKPADTNVR